jgi:hypothetical protein
MFRARLASCTLAAGLLILTGCNTCGPSLRPFHRPQHSDCECSQGVVGAVSGFEGPALLPSDATIMPPPGSTSPPPRIEPVPQAPPVPYAPARPVGLRRLFGQQP